MITKYDIPEPKRDETPVGKFISPTETCEHDWRLVFQVCVDGSHQFKNQCRFCGKATGAIAKMNIAHEQMRGAEPFDAALYQGVYDAAYTAWKETVPTILGEHNALWWTWYNGYLDSGVWRGKTILVARRCHNICEACGLEPVEHIHHLTYAHVGAEPLYDLVGVCGGCHDDLHGRPL